MGGDRNENEGAAGRGREAQLPAPGPPRRALRAPALTLSQLRARHSARIVFPKLLFYKLARVGRGGPGQRRKWEPGSELRGG